MNRLLSKGRTRYVLQFMLAFTVLAPTTSFLSPSSYSTSTFSKPNNKVSLQPSIHIKNKIATIQKRHEVTALKASGLLTEEAKNELLIYFIQTLINVSIPTIATIAVIGFAAASFGRARGKDSTNRYMEEKTRAQELYGDLYGNQQNDGSNLLPFSIPSRNPLKSGLPRNVGIPSEQYIKITHLNTRLDSYAFSISSATESKAKAASNLRMKNFDRALNKVFLGDENNSLLTSRQKMDLEEVEKELLLKGGELVAELEKIQRKSVSNILDDCLDKLEKEMEEMPYESEKTILDAEVVNSTNITTNNSTVNTSSKKASSNFLQNMMNNQNRQLNKRLDEASKINSELVKLELDFMQDVMAILGPQRASILKNVWVGNIVDGTGIGGSLVKSIEERPLSVLLSSKDSKRKNLFVTNFPGDVSASQVSELREEVTAILRSASPGDEALLVLQSGGGTVTGYGLAAAQLRRFKANGIKLTICVEQVAASGGYMMCCVADRVVASPFAVLGSIGVISDIPNAYERLKKEGIEFQTITAGKYKRTITPTKKITQEDVKKSKEDIEDILTLFKGFVKENRPILDIESVATGETWFGQDALDRNLCDEIKTKDDVLLEYVDAGYEVYNVAYEPPTNSPTSLLSFASYDSKRQNKGGGIIKWFVRSIGDEVRKEFSFFNDFEEYKNDKNAGFSNSIMMKDNLDTVNRVRVED